MTGTPSESILIRSTEGERMAQYYHTLQVLVESLITDSGF
jgi:hypothetical protein